MLLPEIPTKDVQRWFFYLFVIEGVIVFVPTTLLALLILLTKKFVRQKEYVLLAVNLLADAIFGFQYAYSGVDTLILLEKNEYLGQTTRWHCYKNFCNQLFFITTPGLGLLTLANALDRVFLVTYPGKYYKLGPLYPLAIVGVIAVIILPIEIMAFLQAYLEPDVPAYTICAPADSLSPTMQIVIRVIRIVTSLTAAVLYFPIVFKVRKIFKTSGLIGQTQQKELKLTLTIALITLSQICMFTISDILILFDTLFLQFHIMNLTKGIINLCIIVFCQSEIRRHILHCGKSNIVVVSKTPPKVQGNKKSSTAIS